MSFCNACGLTLEGPLPKRPSLGLMLVGMTTLLARPSSATSATPTSLGRRYLHQPRPAPKAARRRRRLGIWCEHGGMGQAWPARAGGQSGRQLPGLQQAGQSSARRGVLMRARAVGTVVLLLVVAAAAGTGGGAAQSGGAAGGLGVPGWAGSLAVAFVGAVAAVSCYGLVVGLLRSRRPRRRQATK